MTEDRRPKALVAASTWWPLAARLARALIDEGWIVSALCPPGHPLHFVEGITQFYRYRRLSSLHSLRHAINQAEADLILPCDDGVVWQLHSLYASHPALRPVLVRSLGDPASFATIRSRAHFLQIASGLGVRVPQTCTITSEAQLESCFQTAAALKLDGTWGGNGVQLVYSTEEAVAAFRRFQEPPSRGMAWKRLLIDRDPLALWKAAEHTRPTITLQELVPGRPANTMIVCDRGRMLAALTVEVLCAQGPTGAATIVRVLDHPEITQAACRVARHLGLSGFHGLDFILHERTGEAFLLELNPRCTQLAHLTPEGRPSLAACLSAILGEDGNLGSYSAEQSAAIAFFPQAIKLNPKNPYLTGAFHDVPWCQPALVRDLLRPAWPQRQWAARLYHHLRPPTPQPESYF